MSNESPESPCHPPAEANESNSVTPGALSMGSVVIAALAGVGACGVTCFGGFVPPIRSEEDLGKALTILPLVGLATFVIVVAIHSRMKDATSRNAMTNRDDQFTSVANTQQETDTDDTGQ